LIIVWKLAKKKILIEKIENKATTFRFKTAKLSKMNESSIF